MFLLVFWCVIIIVVLIDKSSDGIWVIKLLLMVNRV